MVPGAISVGGRCLNPDHQAFRSSRRSFGGAERNRLKNSASPRIRRRRIHRRKRWWRRCPVTRAAKPTRTPEVTAGCGGALPHQVIERAAPPASTRPYKNSRDPPAGRQHASKRASHVSAVTQLTLLRLALFLIVNRMIDGRSAARSVIARCATLRRRHEWLCGDQRSARANM